MKTKLTFALVASLTGTAFAGFHAPLPEFKNEKQLAEWRAEKSSEATSQGCVADETAFYTGKPYLASSGGYAFKYRNYNPEMARWTSEDPSGFPDGANGHIYAPSPTSGIDPNGLWKLQIDGATDVFTPSNGIIKIGGFDHRINSTTHLNTPDISSSSTGLNGIVNVDFSGDIKKMNYVPEVDTQGAVEFSISVNPTTGQISISANSGSYDFVNGSLQIGGSWSKEIGDHTAILTFGSASMYGGTGITGLGLQGGAAGTSAGGSVSWTNPAGKQSSFNSLKFKAVE